MAEENKEFEEVFLDPRLDRLEVDDRRRGVVQGEDDLRIINKFN